MNIFSQKNNFRKAQSKSLSRDTKPVSGAQLHVVKGRGKLQLYIIIYQNCMVTPHPEN